MRHLCVLLALVGCEQARTSQLAPAAAPVGQGIRGKALAWVGDFMPGPATEPSRGEIRGISKPITVLRGHHDSAVNTDALVVTTVTADREGNFEVPLPPGPYTTMLVV